MSRDVDLEPSESWPYPLPRSGRDAISALLEDPPADIFREYDIRGLVDIPPEYNPEKINGFLCDRLGRAFGTYLQGLGVDDVVVGYDSRPYAPALAQALAMGLLSTGVRVVMLGLSTTPLVYFAQHELDISGAVVMTASHNPNGWTGLKLSSAPSTTLGPDEIEQFREIVLSGKFRRGIGTLVERTVIPEYRALLANGNRTKRPLRIAVDGGNSISGVIAKDVLEAAGHVVIPVNLELDWSFPNHEPDPELVESRRQLAEEVLRSHADFGVALDGDGDRLGITDEEGKTVFADRVLALLALDVLERHPGSQIVYDVKCSRLVRDVVLAAGGTPVMWKTGHSHIKSKMREIGAPFAGERSGHFFNAVDYFGYDDSIHAALRLAEIVVRSGKSVGQLVEGLPHYYSSPAMQAPCLDAIKYDVVAKATDLAVSSLMPREVIRVNGARLEFDDGWLLVRPSSNTPTLVIVCEADTEARLLDLYHMARSVLDQFDEIGKVWENDIFASTQ